MTATTDHAKRDLMLNALRLPTMRQLARSLGEQSDREGWPAIRTLAARATHERADREQRRRARNLAAAKLLPGKTLSSFDFSAIPAISKAQITARAAGDAWISQGSSCIAIGPPGVGKSHLASAIGQELIENGYRVLMCRTPDLVQKLQTARRELELERMLASLDTFPLLILDDFSYLSKDEAETTVLFELIAVRVERRSLMITANQPFSAWDRLFPDETTAVAAVDRLVHKAVILEMNAESTRRKETLQRQRKAGRPAQYATAKNTTTD